MRPEDRNTVPAGFTVREWQPGPALWISRLWALLSVEAWFLDHAQRGSRRGHAADLLQEARVTAYDVGGLLRELAMQQGEAVASPEFVVWRDGSDFRFVPLRRGTREARWLSDVDAVMTRVARQLGLGGVEDEAAEPDRFQ